MGKNTIAIKEYIMQCLLIVFSVVLGLYLSERIEERKTRQESEELLTTIKAEVKDNMGLLEKWAPYHQDIYKNLDSLKENEAFIAAFINDKSILFEKLLTRGTLMGRSPANDAWDIAKSHPLIMNIEHEQLIILSKVYKQQKGTFEPMYKMGDIFNSKDVNKEQDAKLNLELLSDHFHELVAREIELIRYYKIAAEILDLKNEKEIVKE